MFLRDPKHFGQQHLLPHLYHWVIHDLQAHSKNTILYMISILKVCTKIIIIKSWPDLLNQQNNKYDFLKEK